MTAPPSRPGLLRRRLLYGLLALCVAAIAWVAYFLLTFDLNDYRKDAEARLSALLGVPVRIGSIHLGLNDINLALHLGGLQVGDDTTPLQVDATEVLANLKWRGLLERDIRFGKISLREPRVFLRPQQAGADIGQPAPEPPAIDWTPLRQASISTLEISDGELHVAAPLPGLPERRFALAQIDGVLTDIGLGLKTGAKLAGTLLLPGQATASRWQAEGETMLQLDAADRPVPQGVLQLDIRGVDSKAVGALLVERIGGEYATGSCDLQLNLVGDRDAGYDIRAELSSDDLALAPGAAYGAPIPLRSISAAGHLQLQGERPGLEGLALRVDGVSLAGSLAWTAADRPFALTVALRDSRLAILRLKHWLPAAGAPWESLQERLGDGGELRVEQAELTWRAEAEDGRESLTGSVRGELRQAAWTFAGERRADIELLPFEVDANGWRVTGGKAQVGSIRLDVDGAGRFIDGAVRLDGLDFSGPLQPEALLAEWQVSAEPFAISGPIGLKGHLEGSPAQLSLDLQADLSGFGASHPAGLTLTPAPGDQLALHGTVTPERVTLDHGSFAWAVAKGHLSAGLVLADPDSFALDALLSIDDLARVAETVPVLERLKLHGQAELNITQRGRPGDHPAELTLTLRDAGLRATSHIADIEQINGRVRLSTTGLAAENLHLHLGQSPLTVSARIDDFAAPRLLLDVRAASLRASELIFTSPKSLLKDIRGHLEIDRDGLSFAPVDVRLDGGTRARVRGTIAFHPPYPVNLDIDSEFANIGEVIDLWHKEEKQGGKTDKEGDDAAANDRKGEKHESTPVRITAAARSGDLYGMRFHDATGVIVPSHERVVIHPLDFSVGEGFCNAQVVADFNDDGPTLLRISGHAEDVDALEVYRELLNQKSIVRGKLRGDFYLAGETGGNFLHSSKGNFSLQINRGVLHQFQVLSKVFSLLNVSQIFALQLPDMDSEGMPFTKLAGNFRLDEGVLRSDDLKIQSEAMNQSYTGELDLVNHRIDLALAIHPLGTVDKIVSKIPVAGWLLTGEDGALLTAHFSVRGPTDNVSVEAMPLDTLSEPTIGLLRRTLGLPFKLLKDPQILWGGEATKKP